MDGLAMLVNVASRIWWSMLMVGLAIVEMSLFLAMELNEKGFIMHCPLCVVYMCAAFAF